MPQTMPKPIDEELADVPAYKQGYFHDRDQAQNWRYFNLGLDRMRDLGANERLAYREINAAEGGGVPDASDTNAPGPAVAGITAQTLSGLNVPGVEPGTLPEDLHPLQWPNVYRAYFDTQLSKADGSRTLDKIGHPGVAAFVADTAFRDGPTGVKMIQQSINSVRKQQGLPTVDDGKFFTSGLTDAVNQINSTPEGNQAFAKDTPRQ